VSIASLSKLLVELENKKATMNCVLLQGNDLYWEREFKNALKKLSQEFRCLEIKKSGPTRELEAYSMGGSLFSELQILWLKSPQSLSQWSVDSWKIWEDLKSRCDEQSFWLIVQVPLDKRMNFSKLEIPKKIPLSFEGTDKRAGLIFLNHRRGNFLKAAQLEFLERNFDETLIQYDQWIDLWSLGGDFWAEASLGWRSESSKDFPQDTAKRKMQVFAAGETPAFLWVDAVLRGQKKTALQILDHLLQIEGSEVLQLLALLSKSLRILALLENQQSAAGSSDFLVNKMKNIIRSQNYRKGRATRLLDLCVESDRKLKSSATNSKALLTRISAF
jgi:DNA polymerase III delta subunit